MQDSLFATEWLKADKTKGNAEVVTQRCSLKKMLLKRTQYWRCFFFDKFARWRLATLFRKRLQHRRFPESFATFRRPLLYIHRNTKHISAALGISLNFHYKDRKKWEASIWYLIFNASVCNRTRRKVNQIRRLRKYTSVQRLVYMDWL